MKYLYAFAIVACLIFSFEAQGQKELQDSFEILLRPTPKHDLSGLNFYCNKVIDKRLIKGNIGIIQKGLFNEKQRAIFPLDFTDYLTGFLNVLLQRKIEKDSFIVLFHELRISEQTGATSELGVCRIQIEFVKEIDEEFISYGIFEREIKEKGIDVTLEHGDRILNALKDCILQFNTTEKKPKKTTKLTSSSDGNKTVDFIKGISPKRGLYPNFEMVLANKPRNLDFTVRKSQAKEFTKYFMYNLQGEKIKKQFLYYSDGKSIYVECSQYRSFSRYFVKAKHVGKYIYFEDKYSDPLAGIAFGLLGSAISYVAHAFILDTTSGSILPLDNLLVSKLLVLNKQTKLMINFNKTKGKYKDREAAIIALNKALTQ